MTFLRFLTNNEQAKNFMYTVVYASITSRGKSLRTTEKIGSKCLILRGT